MEESRVYVELVRIFCDLQVYRMNLLGFHWNCTGKDFYYHHLLFERVYGEVDAYIDRVAELIRKFGVTPAAFSVFLNLSSVKEITEINFSTTGMVNEAIAGVNTIRGDITKALSASTAEPGVMNMLGELGETMDKVGYLLVSNR